MCLENSKLQEICKTYPNSHYILKQKALMKRAYLRNSKNKVEEEIKDGLTDNLTKKGNYFKQKKRMEREKNSPKTKKFSSLDRKFHFDLHSVEMESFEDNDKIALERRSSSFESIKEMNFHTGNKMKGEPLNEFKKKILNINIDKKEKKNENNKEKTIKMSISHGILNKELKEQKLLQKMQNLKVY